MLSKYFLYSNFAVHRFSSLVTATVNKAAHNSFSLNAEPDSKYGFDQYVLSNKKVFSICITTKS